MSKLFEHIFRVFDQFSKRKMPVYIIGGAVRDLLLQRPVSDVDFLIPWIDMEEAREIICSAFGSYPRLNRKFRTFNVIRPFCNFDFSMMREEFYKKPGELPEVRSGDLRTDLLRRDFTVNTMLMDSHFNIYDFIGGMEDIERKIIRTVTTVSFLEDPTRVLRGLRFAEHLNFNLADDFEILLRDAGEKRVFEGIEGHRIFAELKLAGKGIKRIYEVLCRAGIWSQMGLGFLEEKNLVKIICDEGEKWNGVEDFLKTLGKSIKEQHREIFAKKMKISKKHIKILEGGKY
uniref:PolyA polymerase family protein n=1 Tax=uncultured prokaryote TaxID=198431 RepID=H5SPZ7_9ZZZZ|nr:polyA polymerase family protein [uncultured prokaryote]